MQLDLIATRSLESYELATYQAGAHRLHRIKVTGPITIRERITLYVEALTLNESHAFFCILDNSAGHPNEFRYQDMSFLDYMLVQYGIRYFVAATITPEEEYGRTVDVANESAQEAGLVCEMISTRNSSDAEEFVLGRMNAEVSHPAT